MEPKLVKEGYTVITPTLCQGDVLAWSTEDESGEIIPDVFDTIRETRLELLATLEEHIREFKNVERDWEEIDFDLGGDYIAEYNEFSDGTILLYGLNDPDKIPILSTTIQAWRSERWPFPPSSPFPGKGPLWCTTFPWPFSCSTTTGKPSSPPREAILKLSKPSRP